MPARPPPVHASALCQKVGPYAIVFDITKACVAVPYLHESAAHFSVCVLLPALPSADHRLSELLLELDPDLEDFCLPLSEDARDLLEASSAARK